MAVGERRFAIVCPNFYPRTCGVGDHSVRLASALERRGHRVAMFSRTPAAPHPEAPDLRVTASDGALPMLIARQLGAAIAEQRPTDVILQYTPQMWEGSRFGNPAVPWLVRRARRAGARVTLIAHELHLAWLRRPDLTVASALQRAQLGVLLRSCDRVLVTTGTRARQVEPLARLVGAPKPGVIRVGPSALPAPARRPGTGRVGVFNTAQIGKRFDVVLDAFAHIAAEIPSAELVLLGDLGAPGHPLVKQVTDAVARHPARARVRLTGKLPLAAVAAEIAALDVYLFPMETGANTRSSTLPTALGSGIPVVATDERETDHDLFRDGENVVFARGLDGAAFAEAALRLLRDQALAARVSAGARRLYDEHLAWDRIADHLMRELMP
jgi:glycosyltransferase involved in cell wall biosynthesis